MSLVSLHLAWLCIAAVLAHTAPIAAQDSLSKLSIERIFLNGDLQSAPVPELHWLRDGVSYIEIRPDTGGGKDIVRVDLETGRSTTILDAAALVDAAGDRHDVEDLALAPDDQKALLFHSSVRVWRENTRGVYHVVDFATGQLTPVSRKPGLQMFAKFSPDGRQVAFVRDNNLFVTDLAAGEERQLTHDGSSVIINGTSDWVYEEELGLRDAFRWSPDSRRIAYWRFDQSGVPVFPMVDQLSLYPRITPLRYPKAGQPNSKVQLGVLNLASGETQWLDVANDPEVYFARMEWVDADSVVIQRLPRRQNRIDVLLASASTGGSRLVLSEVDSAWVEVLDQPTWINGGSQFLWMSERSGWQQLYLYNRDGSLIRRVTQDSADVTEFVAADERRGHVYVVEAAPTPLQRHLFRYALNGKGGRTRVTRAPGTHRVSISPEARYMVDEHTTASQPAVVTLHELPSMRQRRVLEENADLRAKLARLAIRPPEFFTFRVASGVMLNAFRIVPLNFDSTVAYPVLMYGYGGPGSQTVTDDYGGDRYLWHQLLAQKGYVIVSVDNRGTGGRGRDFRKVTYLNLGKYESEDQIDAAHWLASRRWVDADRIGIWGWSYGGYLAALTAAKGGDLFDAAIAIAPVTDWRLYDTIYTERYMWLPRENATGYRAGAPLTHVGSLTADLLVVHGTGDDNVHPQNTVQLAARLQEAGKPFELMLYPNRTHSISGGNTRAHLYGTMTRFVDQYLGDATSADRVERAAVTVP